MSAAAATADTAADAPCTTPCAAPCALDWRLDALRASVQAEQPGMAVQALAAIDSTNTELMRRARAGDARPSLLVAEWQTAGRGRMGREWRSGAGGRPQAGGVLTFSIGLPLPPCAQGAAQGQGGGLGGLSLAVGLALAESLHAGIQIKWPNDLWWQGRKLAGILIETAGHAAARHAVIGVGLNIAALPADGLRTPPAWVREFWPDANAADVLLGVAAPLVRAVRRFGQAGFAGLAAAFAARDALRGRAVQLSDGMHGVACGIAADGALLVRTADGVQAVHSAEASVRPQAVAAGTFIQGETQCPSVPPHCC